MWQNAIMISIPSEYETQDSVSTNKLTLHILHSVQPSCLMTWHNTMGFSITILREVTNTQIQALQITIISTGGGATNLLS